MLAIIKTLIILKTSKIINPSFFILNMLNSVPIPSNPLLVPRQSSNLWRNSPQCFNANSLCYRTWIRKVSNQSSRVDQILSVLGFLEDTISTIRNRFPRKGPTNHIQKYLSLLLIVFRSVLDQFSLVKNPDISQFLIISQSLQFFFRNYHIYQTIETISKNETILSNYLSSLIPFREVFDFQYSRNISPIIPLSRFTDLVLYTKQKLDEYLSTLFFWSWLLPITTTSKHTRNSISPKQSYKSRKYSLSKTTQ